MMLPTTTCTARLLLLQRRATFTRAAAPSSCRRTKCRFLSSSSSDRNVSSNQNNTSYVECSKQAPKNQKQQWMTAADCLDDHAEVWTRLHTILGAYVGPNQLPAHLAESIMVAVNSKNNCPYCEGLHGELARMAGVERHEQLQAAASAEDCTEQVQDPAVAYARTFAENHRGEETPEALARAYGKVVDTHGSDKGRSVEALCWFLSWGSLGGNTVNSVLWEGRRGAFLLAFTIYYAPLFGVIAVLNKGLAHMPNMPGVFFQGMGVTLTVVGGIWMTPVGLLGLSKRMIVG